MGIALLAGFVTVHLEISGLYLSQNTVTVGEGANSFLSDGRANPVNALLAFLAHNVPQGKTLIRSARRSDDQRAGTAGESQSLSQPDAS